MSEDRITEEDVFKVDKLKGLLMVKAAKFIENKYISIEFFEEQLKTLRDTFKDKHEYLVLLELEDATAKGLYAITGRRTELEATYPKFLKGSKRVRPRGKRRRPKNRVS